MRTVYALSTMQDTRLHAYLCCLSLSSCDLVLKLFDSEWQVRGMSMDIGSSSFIIIIS